METILDQPRRPMLLHGQRLRIAEGWQGPLAAVGIQPGADWTSYSRGVPVTAAPITSAFRVELGDGRRVYFKRYVYPPGSDRFYWMVPSKAVIEAWAYGQLAGLGIPTLQTIAVGEIRRYGRVMAACIVTLEEPDTVNLEIYAEQVWKNLPAAERSSQAAAIADSLIPQLQRAHRHGFFHYDLKWRNLLVKKRDDRFEMIWIDSPRSRRKRPGNHRGRLVDLAALARLATAYFSLREQRALLARYLEVSVNSPDVSRWMRSIAGYLSRRLPEHLK